jgi:hypothetical protein
MTPAAWFFLGLALVSLGVALWQWRRAHEASRVRASVQADVALREAEERRDAAEKAGDVAADKLLELDAEVLQARTRAVEANKDLAKMSAENLLKEFADRRKRRGPGGGGTVLLLSSLLLAGSVARAQEQTPDDPPVKVEGPEEAVVVHQGVEGLWFRPDVAAGHLRDLRELDTVRNELRIRGEQLRLWEQRGEYLEAAAAASDDAATRALTLANKAEARATDAEELLDVWWRSPLLWLSVGAALGVAATVLLVSLLGTGS